MTGLGPSPLRLSAFAGDNPISYFALFAFFAAILIFGCGYAASIFTHDDAIFGMGGRADRLAGLESLGGRRDDV